NLVANLILIVSILGVIIMVVRRLPQAVGEHEQDKLADDSGLAGEVLAAEKGLPTKTASRIKTWLQIFWHRIWHFMLEAKGLKHAPKISYNFKRILKKDKEAEVKP